MGAKHMLKYHLLLPLGIAGALLVVGAPLNVAVVAGMMAGCMVMVLSMARESSSEQADATGTDRPVDDSASHRGH